MLDPCKHSALRQTPETRNEDSYEDRGPILPDRYHCPHFAQKPGSYIRESRLGSADPDDCGKRPGSRNDENYKDGGLVPPDP